MTVLDVDTSLDTLEAMDFEPACESRAHGQGVRLPNGQYVNGHGGDGMPATLLYTGICPKCGSEKTLLVCEGHRERLTTARGRIWDTSGGCSEPSPAKEWHLVWVPLPGGSNNGEKE